MEETQLLQQLAAIEKMLGYHQNLADTIPVRMKEVERALQVMREDVLAIRIHVQNNEKSLNELRAQLIAAQTLLAKIDIKDLMGDQKENNAFRIRASYAVALAAGLVMAYEPITRILEDIVRPMPEREHPALRHSPSDGNYDPIDSGPQRRAR